MKTSGHEYDYIIRVTDDGKNSSFEILCQNKKSKTISGITNLNFILSDVVSQVMNEKNCGDSWITTSTQKAEKLYHIAADCFKSKTWIKYLECALDNDRECGEWEAMFAFMD